MRIDISPSALRWHYFSCGWTSSWFFSWLCPIADCITWLPNFVSTNWMEEVRIFTVSVAIAGNGTWNFSILFVFIFPSTSTVLWVSPLKSPKKLSVIIGNLSDFLDSVGPIQTIVGIESTGVRLWLLSRVGRHMPRWLQVDLQHLSQQNSVLILYFWHAL